MKTKTQFTNRILSLVLSIMMVISMLPMNVLTASAADGDAVAKVGDTEYTDFATAVANWTDGTTLTLLADVTGLTECIKTYAKGLILDLNGHKIECSDTLCTIWIDGDSGSELTIRDGKGDGYIQGQVYAVAGGSKLRLESGTVETVTANGDFIMTGGQIICEDSRGLFVNDEVDVVISGGEIYGSNYGVWITSGNVIISGDTKITGAGQYAITSFSSKVVISGTPTISGGTGEFWLMEKITLNTQPADGETWRVEIDTEEITDGLFAVPGEGVTLDASKFASTMDGYDVKQNAKGELLLCNHQTAYAAVSNEDGSTHKMLCCCRETTVEASVACSGFGATCQTKAACAACGQSYGETNPDVHTFNDDGKCVCGAERDAATTVDLSSLTATYVISDSGEYIFTGTGSYGIKVESGNPKIVLNNVNISLTDGDYYENNPINGIHIATTGGTTEILVLGESSITAKAGAGIFVAEGGTVKITGSSREDILIATGASGCSGIGGYVYYTNGSVNCGNIEISNVTVKAFGSDSSMGDRTPAIGGAGNGNCGYITIDNADVYAEGFINPYGFDGSSAIGTGVGWRNREGGTIGEISIINDSKVYVTRGNYCDYIGCSGSESDPAEGVVDATAKSSTIYCYDTTDTTKPIQTLKYGALGGLLKEDGTCEGEHSGGTATCKEQAICGNCGASYGELLDHNWKNGECTYGCNTQHDPHDWESGICNVCGLVCAHTGGAATCTTLAVCDICGTSYGEVGGHTPAENATYTDNGDGTHSYICTLCGATIVEEHSFENDAHQCVCGVVETFSVSWILSASLMQSTSTYGQDFTQTFTVPENTHLEIYGVHLEDDSTIPVNYTYENGVLTIAAEDVPAADVYIDCYHYVEVTFHANGGELIPEDGFPQEGSNDIFPEDGSYWTQEWNYWSEICLVNCAEVRREGYTFVDWRDASGQVHQVIPGYGNYTLATEDITLYAQWQCNHTIGGVVFRDNGNGTHNGYCGECDELLDNYVGRPHDFGDNTHKCVCGKKITPEVTAPTAKTNLIYDGSEQELINAGSTTGGTLQYSLDNVTWSAEIPTAISVGTHTVYYKVVGDENYEDVEEQSIIVTITDKTLPTGTILIKENGWNKFWNTITFGIFCKDYVDVTITADGTGSSVTKVEYLLSGTALEENNIPVDGWTTLNADNGKYSFSIKPQNKVAVYVRITDEGGNVTVINSDGIVVYEDSKAVDTEVTYTYKENSNKDIAVEFNGNTVKSIVCSEKVLAANSDYTVDYESGKIVLTASYLDTLNAGDYTFTVSYNPMGVENSGVTDLTTTFIVKVEPTSIAGATVNVSGTFTYDGNAKTPDPVVVLNGETLVKDRDYTVSYAENVNAGTATVTVIGKGNYSGTKTATFSIAPMELDETNTVVTLDQNTFVYDGTEHKPAVTVTFNGATLTEGVDYRVFYSQPMRIVNGKVDKWFGDHTTSVECVNVDGDYYAVVVGLGNFRTKDAFTLYANFVIEKATVTEPTIASKPYSGSAQMADISDTDLYTVEKNNGGTAKGEYDVVLKLTDAANYKWSTTESAEVTLKFVISAAENSWTTDPSISGWTYGEAAKAPVGTAKYGAVKLVYTGKANDGTDYNSETAPTKAGNYTATFTVTGTEDYSGLSEQVNFTIAKKAVTVTANDAGKTYGESDPALTYTHTELVGSDALIITVARASGENANTYTINASQAEGANPNYEITFKTGTFTIHKATLTVTAEDKTATYGDAVPTYTVKYEGFKNGDDKDDLGGALAFECGYAQFSDKGEYTIKASGYTSGNYTISYVDGKLTVNAKPITVTIQNATSVYGDTLAELKATDNGIVNGDANVYSLATTATGTSNVGKYAITGTALDSNYDVTFVNGEYEITKREITITVDAKNTVVNTTLPIYTYKVEGLVGVDTLVTEPTLTCNANIEVIGEYDITASSADAGGNYSIKYVPAKLTVLTDNAVDAAAGYTEELKDYDPATVTSEDKAELDEMLSEINTILADETTTDNGKKALEEVKEQVEKLIKEITDAAEAIDTENTEKVENVTPENVTPENKTDLEGAKADLEKALEDNGGNYTEDEKKAIEDEIKRIDEALEVIGNVEAVEEVISKLPAVDTVKPDDEEAIKAITDAQTAYNALSDYEKSLVDEATKAALDKLAAALVAYDIVEGDGSSWTEDSDHNITFVVNGLFSKFVGIKVDGKDVDKANYEAKAGSTIITLKASYLDTLAVGEHTITVVYTDGSTDGTFNVHAKANSPATGDDFNIALYSSLMTVSVTALVVLLLASKKRKQVK